MCACLFTFISLWKSLVMKKSILKSPLTVLLQLVYTFISYNFYFIYFDVILSGIQK